MKTTVKLIVNSASFYPITALYAAGVVILLLATGEQLTISTAVLSMLMVAVIAMFLSTKREVAIAQRLLTTQRIELLRRIDELEALLEKASINYPRERRLESNAREDREEEIADERSDS